VLHDLNFNGKKHKSGKNHCENFPKNQIFHIISDNVGYEKRRCLSQLRLNGWVAQFRPSQRQKITMVHQPRSRRHEQDTRRQVIFPAYHMKYDVTVCKTVPLRIEASKVLVVKKPTCVPCLCSLVR